MNQQTVSELTHLYSALNPTLQVKKSTQSKTRETSLLLNKIENRLKKFVDQISENIGNFVKSNRMLTTK